MLRSRIVGDSIANRVSIFQTHLFDRPRQVDPANHLTIGWVDLKHVGFVPNVGVKISVDVLQFVDLVPTPPRFHDVKFANHFVRGRIHKENARGPITDDQLFSVVSESPALTIPRGLTCFLQSVLVIVQNGVGLPGKLKPFLVPQAQSLGKQIRSNVDAPQRVAGLDFNLPERGLTVASRTFVKFSFVED